MSEIAPALKNIISFLANISLPRRINEGYYKQNVSKKMSCEFYVQGDLTLDFVYVINIDEIKRYEKMKLK